jgi:hypothetical protein
MGQTVGSVSWATPGRKHDPLSQWLTTGDAPADSPEEQSMSRSRLPTLTALTLTAFLGTTIPALAQHHGGGPHGGPHPGGFPRAGFNHECFLPYRPYFPGFIGFDIGLYGYGYPYYYGPPVYVVPPPVVVQPAPTIVQVPAPPASPPPAAQEPPAQTAPERVPTPRLVPIPAGS